MAKKGLKRPANLNRLAQPVTDDAVKDDTQSDPKNQAAVELGRLGGLKGGRARAAKLTPERRSEIAQRAAEARWHKEDA